MISSQGVTRFLLDLSLPLRNKEIWTTLCPRVPCVKKILAASPHKRHFSDSGTLSIGKCAVISKGLTFVEFVFAVIPFSILIEHFGQFKTISGISSRLHRATIYIDPFCHNVNLVSEIFVWIKFARRDRFRLGYWWKGLGI